MSRVGFIGNSGEDGFFSFIIKSSIFMLKDSWGQMWNNLHFICSNNEAVRPASPTTHCALGRVFCNLSSFLYKIVGFMALECPFLLLPEYWFHNIAIWKIIFITLCKSFFLWINSKFGFENIPCFGIINIILGGVYVAINDTLIRKMMLFFLCIHLVFKNYN